LGYSLYDFDVYRGDVASKGLSDVHFIKLILKNKSGETVSENTYWRGNARKDFTALNNIPKVKVSLATTTREVDGKVLTTVNVINPASSRLSLSVSG